MFSELDPTLTQQFVLTNWFAGDAVGLEKRVQLANRARDYALDWYMEDRCFLPPPLRATIENSWHAAVLSGAVDQHGMTFEQITRLTNFEVAGMVVSITPDNRLPAPRRMRMHVSDLGQAEPCPQIIRLVQLAELVDDAQQRFLDDADAAREWLREWLPEHESYVEALWRLGESATLAPEWNRLHTTCSDLAQAIARWRMRDKILARIQERLAAPKRNGKTKPKSKSKSVDMSRKGGNIHGHAHPWYHDGASGSYRNS